MKPLCVLALLLGLGAAGVAVYHRAETWPNLQANEARAAHADYRTTIGRLDQAVYEEYRAAAWLQIYSMWGLGGLGVALGAIGAAKGKGKPRVLAAVGVLGAVAAVIVSLTTQMAGRIG